jgi:hypothetical protein
MFTAVTRPFSVVTVTNGPSPRNSILVPFARAHARSSEGHPVVVYRECMPRNHRARTLIVAVALVSAGCTSTVTPDIEPYGTIPPPRPCPGPPAARVHAEIDADLVQVGLTDTVELRSGAWACVPAVEAAVLPKGTLTPGVDGSRIVVSITNPAGADVSTGQAAVALLIHGSPGDVCYDLRSAIAFPATLVPGETATREFWCTAPPSSMTQLTVIVDLAHFIGDPRTR